MNAAACPVCSHINSFNNDKDCVTIKCNKCTIDFLASKKYVSKSKTKKVKYQKNKKKD